MYDLSASVIWTCVFVDYRSAVIRFIRAIIEPFSFKENPAMSDCTYRNILILNIVSMIYSSILLSLYILFILLQKCKHWGRRWTCFPLSVIFPLSLHKNRLLQPKKWFFPSHHPKWWMFCTVFVTKSVPFSRPLSLSFCPGYFSVL